jgi:hypothetical protein
MADQDERDDGAGQRRPARKPLRPAVPSEQTAYVAPVDVPANSDDVRRTRELRKVQINPELDPRRRATVRRVELPPQVSPAAAQGSKGGEVETEITAPLGTPASASGGPAASSPRARAFRTQRVDLEPDPRAVLAMDDLRGTDAPFEPDQIDETLQSAQETTAQLPGRGRTIRLPEGAASGSPSAAQAPPPAPPDAYEAVAVEGPRGTMRMIPRKRGGTWKMAIGVAAGELPDEGAAAQSPWAGSGDAGFDPRLLPSSTRPSATPQELRQGRAARRSRGAMATTTWIALTLLLVASIALLYVVKRRADRKETQVQAALVATAPSVPASAASTAAPEPAPEPAASAAERAEASAAPSSEAAPGAAPRARARRPAASQGKPAATGPVPMFERERGP